MSTEHPERKEYKAWMIKHSSTTCHSSWRRERERKENWAPEIDWIHSDSIFCCKRRLFFCVLAKSLKVDARQTGERPVSYANKSAIDECAVLTSDIHWSGRSIESRWNSLLEQFRVSSLLCPPPCLSSSTDGRSSLWIAINHRWQISLSFTWSSSYIISSCVCVCVSVKENRREADNYLLFSSFIMIICWFPSVDLQDWYLLKKTRWEGKAH